jgi:hypothetical protein
MRGGHQAGRRSLYRHALASQEDATVVRWIFNEFVDAKKTDVAIARRLNQAEILNQHGRPWTEHMIHRILRNENYVGNIVYNRVSRRLGQRRVSNPPDRWVRSGVVFDPIVDRERFERAQKIMDNRYVSISEDEMLLRLRLLLKRKGNLSFNSSRTSLGSPAPHHIRSISDHFGRHSRGSAIDRAATVTGSTAEGTGLKSSDHL